MRTTYWSTGILCVLAVAGIRAEVPRKQDIPKYIKELQSASNAKVRADAAEAIGHRGALKKADVLDAIEPLLDALKSDRAAPVRKAAANALAAISPDAAVAVPALMESLKDESVDVRIAAANALGSFGRDAQEAAAALREVKKEAEKGFAKKSKKKTPAERKQQQLARAAGMALRAISGKPRKK